MGPSDKVHTLDNVSLEIGDNAMVIAWERYYEEVALAAESDPEGVFMLIKVRLDMILHGVLNER